MPVWANFSILYGLVEFGNCTGPFPTAKVQLTNLCAGTYRIEFQTAKI